jgi:ATP-binding cassette subfamily B protein
VRASSAVEALRLHGSVLRAMAATNAEIRSYLEMTARHHSLRTLFRRYPPFVRLETEALGVLLGALTPVSVPAGTVIIREGDETGPAYIVEEGRLQAAAGGAALAFYRAGDVFAERSLFTGTRRAATVTAVIDCRLLLMTEDILNGLLEQNPQFRAEMATRIEQYDYRATARVPLDFAQEILPAAAEATVDAEREAALEPRLVLAPGVEVEDFETTGGEPAVRSRTIRRFPQVLQVDEMDCGAACLAMVARYFRRPVSLARARRLARTGIDGSSLRGILRGVRELGIDAKAIKASRRNLARLPLPAIVHWKNFHWIVLYRVGARHVWVADPATGVRRLPVEEFTEGWNGFAALLEPGPEPVESRSGPQWGWLRPLVRPFRGGVVVASLLALVASGLHMTIPLIAKVVVDRVVASRGVGLLPILLGAFAAIIVASTTTSFFQRYVLARMAVRLDASTLDRIAERMLSLPLGYFQSRKTGDIEGRLTGMRQAREVIVQDLVMGLTALAQVLVAGAMMLLVSPVLGCAFAVSVPLYIAIARLAGRRLRPMLHGLAESFADYHSYQVDAVKGVETVKALGAEDRLRADMVRRFDGLARRQFRVDLATSTYLQISQLVGMASLGFALWLGAVQVVEGRLTLGGLISFQMLLALALPAVAMLVRIWDELQRAAVPLHRLSDIFEEEPEQGADHLALRPVPTLEGRVRFKDVSFSYDGASGPKILDGVSLDVAPGTTVAIVGRSGSGKTTLARCLAGLIEPTEGCILYDGADMTGLEYRELRRHIGFVLQENFLFSDTIARNIALGEEDPDAARVEWAAKVANCHEFVERFPLGYETRVGETGLLLSGGQRQRVAIARAVYNSPPVLILDEATSSLDAESERAVQENMDRLLEGRTSFVIAHRLSTIRNADLIVVLERGRLVEQGTHDELMARRGLYFYLCSQQLGE